MTSNRLHEQLIINLQLQGNEISSTAKKKLRSRRWDPDVRERARLAAEERDAKAEFESIPSAGRRLGIGKNAAYQLARAGIMPVQQTGKRRKKVPKEWVNRRIEELLGKADEQATVKTPSAPHEDP